MSARESGQQAAAVTELRAQLAAQQLQTAAATAELNAALVSAKDSEARLQMAATEFGAVAQKEHAEWAAKITALETTLTVSNAKLHASEYEHAQTKVCLGGFFKKKFLIDGRFFFIFILFFYYYFIFLY